MTEEVVDALPYIDVEYEESSTDCGNPGMRAYVDALVQAEMQTMANPYAVEPVVLRVNEEEYLKQRKEINGRKLKKSCEDVAELEQALALTESERVRLLNLSLQAKYGVKAVDAEIIQLQGLLRAGFKRLEVLEQQIDDVNKKRKMEQMKAGSVLQALDCRIKTSVANISMLQQAISNQ